MGSCYSHKAGGGKYKYTTVQMASTKLEDTSRLARPTPYCRNMVRKGIPIATRSDQSPNLGLLKQQSELKNARNPSPSRQQSSIPRFNSNVPSPHAKNELNENVVNNQNDNSVNNNNNNNPIISSGANRSTESLSKPDMFRKRFVGITPEKKGSKINSKSCPDHISKEETPRLSQKVVSHVASVRSLLPHFMPKTVFHGNIEATPECKSQINFKSPNGCKSNVNSSSQLTSDSLNSIANSDSGIGCSLTESNKERDSDTLKEMEGLVTCDTEKPADNLKCPEYKRGINGKWNLESASIMEFNHSPPTSNEGKVLQCQIKSPHKISSNVFTTYASYKGQLSNKKYASKPTDIISCNFIENKTPSKTVYLSEIPNVSPNLVSPKSDEKISSEPTVPVSPSSNSSKNSCIESDDKSEGLGSDSKSPSSEIENREFLIDDEIADQPSLIFSGKLPESPTLSLRQSVTELHALQSMSCRKQSESSKLTRERLGSDHRDSLLLSSEMGSSCSSIASDDLMMDFEKKSDFLDGIMSESMSSPLKKVADLQQLDEQISELKKVTISDPDDKVRKRLHRRLSGPNVSGQGKDEWRLRSVSLPLRPPRPMSVSEADDGSIVLDSSSYRLLSQDLTGMKTMLLRLKNVIQEAETINPFDHASTKNIFYQSLANSEPPFTENTQLKANQNSVNVENADLRRQVVFLQKQLEEKSRTIHLLQQQMTKYTNATPVQYNNLEKVNATTQTDRSRSLTGSLTSSLENSSETLVSVPDTSEGNYEDS